MAKHRFFLCASSPDAGLTTVSLGMARALDRRGVRVAFCKPISQRPESEEGIDPSFLFAERFFSVHPPGPINLSDAERHVREDRVDDLLEQVVDRVESLADKADVLVVEGLLAEEAQTFKNRLNRDIARAIGAEILFVGRFDADGGSAAFGAGIEMAASIHGGIDSPSVVGCIANRVPSDPQAAPATGEEAQPGPPEPPRGWMADVRRRIAAESPVFRGNDLAIVGCIPENRELQAVRTRDIADFLGAEILSAGDLENRRVRSIALCARNVTHLLHVLKPGALIVTPSDRDDVLMAVCLSAMNRVPLAGLIVTGRVPMNENVFELCRPGIEGSGLPVMRADTDSFGTASALSRISSRIPADDLERMERAMDFVARHLDFDWFEERLSTEIETRLSPAAFRHRLTRKARRADRRIVLPEGEEPRTIAAAIACANREIARCVLLGRPAEVGRIAGAQGLELPDRLEVRDPAEIAGDYLDPLLERRRHKGLTEERAREELEDTVVLGTMMLALGEVDGLVSGAVHSSANTIRPALKLIKTRPGAKLVSSVFFMCLPDQVLVYGDCAVNPDPGAEQLADIALQSAGTARSFGIEPRVAMISYSTGSSGSGVDVEKVRQATEMARSAEPGLLLDGPLQYDAAAIPDVAAKKAPESPLHGRANVFVFPDLNTGNTTYKAVQRSARLVSIGPVLQGLRKPVNDLSRGALVDDIIYTIAVTAIQAADGTEPIPNGT